MGWLFEFSMADCRLPMLFSPNPSSFLYFLKRQCIDARYVVEKSQFKEFSYVGIPEAPDIHGILTRKMNHPLHHLCLTIDIVTPPGRFFFQLLQLISTNRTFVGKADLFFIACSGVRQRLYDVRDYIACSFNQHRITDHQILFPDHILIK